MTPFPSPGPPPTAPAGEVRERLWTGYVLAIGMSVLALAVRLHFSQWFGERAVLILFVPPIFLSAYIGGLGPGLVATAITALGASYFLIPPLRSFAMGRATDLVHWLVLVAVGILISTLTAMRLDQLIARRPTRRGSFSTERKVQAGFACALASLCIVGVLALLSLARQDEEVARVGHSHEVIGTLRQLHAGMIAGQNAQRGFTIMRTPEFVDRFDAAARETEVALQHLRMLTATDPRQLRRWQELAPLVSRRMGLAREVIELRRVQDLEEVRSSPPALAGQSLQEQIAGLVAVMEAREQELLRERSARADRQSTITRTAIVGGSVLAFAFVAVALFTIRRDFAGSRHAEAALREANEQLEARVAERTAELQGQRAELQLILDTVPAMIFYKDRQHRLMRVNRELAEMMGRRREEVEGFSDGELGSPHADRYHRDEDEVMATGVPKRQLIEPLDTPRGERWLQTDKIARRDGQGGIVGIIGFAVDITERREAEAARKVSEARYRALFECAPDGIIIANPEQRYLDANASICRMLGYTREELLGLTTSDIVAAAEIPQIAPALATLRAGSDYHGEWLLRGKDGTLSTVEIIATIMPDGNRLSMIRDITARKQAERRLGMRNAVSRVLADAASLTAATPGILRAICEAEGWDFGSIWEVDAAAGVLCCRETWQHPEFDGAAMAAHSRRVTFARGLGLPGRVWVAGETQLIPEVALDPGYVRAETATASGLHSALAFPVLVGGEVTGVIDFASREIHPPDGPMREMFAAIGRQVGQFVERQRAEEALRASEEHFRFLNDLSEATRALADPTEILAVTARLLGEQLHVSRCAYADVEPDGEGFTILHDYTDGCASTVGKYQLSLFGPRAVATLCGGRTLVIRDVAAELTPEEGADMFQAIGIQAIITCPLVKEGGLRAMMAVHQTTPRDWQPGEIAMVQEVVERCWAALERRTAEEKVHQLNAVLEQRVVERTTQLEAANLELEAFSYSVSHDLRAPLRAVDGFSQALLEDYAEQLPEEAQRFLQTIRGGAQKMGKLIDALLTFSRLSRAALHKQAVPTGELVRGVLDDLLGEHAGRSIELQVGHLPVSWGDPALLRQVWVNLLSNAFKYSRKRDAAVIEVGCMATPEGSVFFVRDNGTGFDMRYADKLFGVFQRLHRAEDYAGTGVGLAIVQRVVHRHGGRIWAEAAEDRGAAFHFTLEESNPTNEPN